VAASFISLDDRAATPAKSCGPAESLFNPPAIHSRDHDDAALATRPVPAQGRFRATAPDRTPDVGTAPRSRIDNDCPKAVSLSIK